MSTRIMKLFCRSCVFASALIASGAAAADSSFGKAYSLIVSGERLFGATVTTNKADSNSHTSRLTTVTLFSNRLQGLASTYSMPRIGIDFAVIDGLTVGAALGYGSVSSDDGDDNSDDEVKYSSILLAPRVGYAVRFNDTVALWPRLGVTYVKTSFDESDSEASSSRTAATAEAMIIITPVPHAAFIFGPTLDFSLAGSDKTGHTKEDAEATDFGLQAGLSLYF